LSQRRAPLGSTNEQKNWACVEDELSAALRAGSPATFISTVATIQDSFASAADFFNSLPRLL